MYAKMTIIGYVGKDPQCRTIDGEKNMYIFSVATTRRKGSGTNKENKTIWHRVVCFGALGEKVVKPLIKKGSKVHIVGDVDEYTYEKDGEFKYIRQVIVDAGGSILVLSHGDEPGNAEKAFSEASENFGDDIPF